MGSGEFKRFKKENIPFFSWGGMIEIDMICVIYIYIYLFITQFQMDYEVFIKWYVFMKYVLLENASRK